MLNAPTRESQWSRSDREYLQENRIQQSMGIVSKIRPRSSSADVKGLACIILELMLIHSPKQSWKNNAGCDHREDVRVWLCFGHVVPPPTPPDSRSPIDEEQWIILLIKELLEDHDQKQREESLVDPEELALAGRRLHEKYIEAQNVKCEHLSEVCGGESCLFYERGFGVQFHKTI
ncbi:hypothetical protein L1049_011207 [Liquidambar formosana]|uniref:Uncharacterized protein n=1 Tax=Liquidambar formosana TaxID=63359 RepID=A0AAP0RX63_LIQFO